MTIIIAKTHSLLDYLNIYLFKAKENSLEDNIGERGNSGILRLLILTQR